MNLLIEAQYLPPIAYFCTLWQARSVTLEKHERYVKQTYRNRCYVNTAGGVVKLVVPVIKPSSRTPIKDTLVACPARWKNIHWRTIEAAYRKAPFFEHFAPGLRQALFHDEPRLYALNQRLLSFCLQSICMDIPLSETTDYEKQPQTDSIIDLRSAIHPRASDRAQLFYKPAAYFQVFGSKFVANLSFIDLLFCEGRAAADIVRSSIPAGAFLSKRRADGQL